MKAGSELNLEAHQGGSDVRWGFKKPGMRSTRVSGAENVFPVCVCVCVFFSLLAYIYCTFKFKPFMSG